MGQNLRDFYRQEIDLTGKTVRNFPWQNPEFYAAWLSQTHFYQIHSTRVVAFAGGLFPYSMNEFHLNFMEYAREEKNHEKLLIFDLKDLERKITDYNEIAETQALYQSQYYWIQHVHPITIYGYFLYLEGIAVEHGQYILDKVESAFGGKAARCLKVHINEDVDHTEGHFKSLANLKEEHVELIKKNLHVSARLYENMMLRMQHQPALIKKAA